MKISEMIKNLQEFMDEHGDLDCWYAVDCQLDVYHRVHHGPSLRCVDNEDDQVYDVEDFDYLTLRDGGYTTICVVS